MSAPRNNDVIQKIKALFRTSRDKALSINQVNDELRDILKNRDNAQFNGQSVATLWTILINYGYGYTNKNAAANHPIPDDIWRELLKATAEHTNNINLDELKNILSIFNRMNIWQNADSEFANFRKSFITVIDHYFPKLNINQTLRTLMNFGYQWADLPKAMQNDVHHDIGYLIDDQNAKELLDQLWICAGLCIPHDEIADEDMTGIIKQLTIMINKNIQIIKDQPCVDLSGHSPWSIATTTLRQIKQVCLYFQFPLAPDLEKALNDVLNNCIQTELAIANSEKQYRTFQDSVMKVVKKIAKEYDIVYKEEAAPLHYKPVDIYFPEKGKILELNGPLHYNLHGSLRPSDLLNKNIHEKNGYQVECLKQSDWKSSHDKYQLISEQFQFLGLIDQLKTESNVDADNNNSQTAVKKNVNDNKQEDKSNYEDNSFVTFQSRRDRNKEKSTNTKSPNLPKSTNVYGKKGH